MIDRRIFCGGLLAASAGLPAIAGCSPPATTDADPFAPRVPLQAGDYATDRAHFRTRLLRHGPSPQSQAMPAPPSDATVMHFTSGGVSLASWVGRPEKAPARAPVVIFLHGGFAFGADDFDMARPFLDAGYVVFTPILRGEDGQAGAFSMFYDEVDDVIALIDHVGRLPYVDPNQLYLAGHSIGGTMTMLTAMASARLRAVVSMSGSPDQVLWINGGGYARIAPFDLNDPREFIMRSPLSYAKSFKAPARLFHGSQESFFRATNRKLAEIAHGAGLDVAAAEFPGDHFGAVPAEIAAAIAFFKSTAAH